MPPLKKRFNRYFTTPITDSIYEALEKVKWRSRLDKTEVMRRMFEYFLTLPPDSQDKILRSFDSTNERTRPRRKPRPEAGPVVAEEAPKAPPVVAGPRVIKRSGLP